MRFYRTMALALATTFLVVGIVFLTGPHIVQALFDWMARWVAVPGMPAGEVGAGLFGALAVAYMYMVSLLAWMMFRRPTEAVWPALLAHAKLASAALSFILMVAQGPTVICAANGVVDGLIGVLALILRRQVIRRLDAATPRG
ncbi:MAG: hypothetical protein IMZ55_09650 [Acidobacteria bacterium]|nr:hypothetical protein [Planctomycetota bacterium]MBE3133728.1 hypothetical protein [Acidobacteriota bacterium]